MPVVLLTLSAVSPTGFSVRSLWALADFSNCSSRFTVRVSFLLHSFLCPSSEMTSLPHGCNFLYMHPPLRNGSKFPPKSVRFTIFFLICTASLERNMLGYIGARPRSGTVLPKRWPLVNSGVKSTHYYAVFRNIQVWSRLGRMSWEFLLGCGLCVDTLPQKKV